MLKLNWTDVYDWTASRAQRVADIRERLQKAIAHDKPAANLACAVDRIDGFGKAKEIDIWLSASELEELCGLLHEAGGAVCEAQPEFASAVAGGVGPLQASLEWWLQGVDRASRVWPRASLPARAEIARLNSVLDDDRIEYLRAALVVAAREEELDEEWASQAWAASEVLKTETACTDAMAHAAKAECAEFIFDAARRRNIQPAPAEAAKLLEGAVFLLRQELSARGIAAPVRRARA